MNCEEYNEQFIKDISSSYSLAICYAANWKRLCMDIEYELFHN